MCKIYHHHAVQTGELLYHVLKKSVVYWTHVSSVYPGCFLFKFLTMTKDQLHIPKKYILVYTLLTSYLNSGALWWYRCYIKVAAIH